MVSKKNVGFALLLGACFIPLFLTFNRGINYFDEGYIVEGARKIYSGEVPYRDFHFVYPPLSIQYLALFFRIFGPYLIVERVAALIISIIGGLSLALLMIKLTKNKLVSILTVLTYVLWGPTHINFLWPVLVVLPLVFIYFNLIVGRQWIYAGMVACLILLCKHNLGIAVVAALLLYVLVIRMHRSQVFLYFIGLMGGMLLFLVYLLVTNSLIPFVSDMYRYTIQEILIKKSFTVPFPTHSIAKFLLYVFPGALALFVAAGLYLRKDTSYLFIPLTLFFFYMLAIFPTPDWTHLMPLISFTGILFALIPAVAGKRSSILSGLLMALVISGGIWSTVFRNYYRWEAPITKHTHCFFSTPMKYMCLDGKNWAIVAQTMETIRKEAGEDSPIFTFYNAPIYYLLTQKQNPTRYVDYVVPVGEREEKKVIKSLEDRNVNIILTRFAPRNSQSTIISDYIQEMYTPIQNTYEFTVWKKR